MTKTWGLVFLASMPPVALAGNVVLDWNQTALDAILTNRVPPPMASRALSIMHTAMYDSWAAYEKSARPLYLDADLCGRVGGDEYGNKQASISYAAFRTLVDLFPASTAHFKSVMRGLGYDPADNNRSASRPAGIGNLAADAVLAARHHDGSNQLGDLSPGAYSDYTGYRPVNTVDQLNEPGRWQPLRQADGEPQRFLVPQWGKVEPFALSSGSEFRPDPPPAWGTALNRERCEQLRQFSAGLDDRQKMIVEYWEDGTQTVTPPGHWNVIAQFVAERDDLSLDKSVKLFLLLNGALMDAGIAAWDAKVAYDSGRPITELRELYRDQIIEAWGGPGVGTTKLPGSQWTPYLATPPFAEYVSGHSTFSAAAAEILRRFTGSDRYEGSVDFEPGSSRIEIGASPVAAVRLSWATFTDAANEAGLSRRLGGIHFEDADLEGRRMGRLIARKAWDKGQSLFDARGRHAVAN